MLIYCHETIVKEEGGQEKNLYFAELYNVLRDSSVFPDCNTYWEMIWIPVKDYFSKGI